MYELMGLLGLIATPAFIHAFVYRRRRYLIVFAICQALMLYTHAWGIFFGVGAAIALIPVWLVSEDRRGLVRDAVLAFGGAGVLFLPWLPNFIYQAHAHRGAVGAAAAVRGAGADLPRPDGRRPRSPARCVLGAVDRAGAAVRRAAPRARATATMLWTLIALPIGDAGGGVARVADHAGVRRPGTSPRCWRRCCCWRRWGCARAGDGRAGGGRAVGRVRRALVSYAPPYKSDMRDVARRDGAAAAPRRSGHLRPARAGAAGLVLPARAACGTRHDRACQGSAATWTGSTRSSACSTPTRRHARATPR